MDRHQHFHMSTKSRNSSRRHCLCDAASTPSSVAAPRSQFVCPAASAAWDSIVCPKQLSRRLALEASRRLLPYASGDGGALFF